MTSPELLGSVNRVTASVHLERTLPAHPEDVWAALTEPHRLEHWLEPVTDGNPGPGGTFVLRMTAEDTATCTVTAWDPPHRLDLTWDYTGEGASLLGIRLSEVDGGTGIALAHDELPTDPAEHAARWHVYLDCLADHLVGIDRSAGTCGQPAFTARRRVLEKRYAEAAVG